MHFQFPALHIRYHRVFSVCSVHFTYDTVPNSVQCAELLPAYSWPRSVVPARHPSIHSLYCIPRPSGIARCERNVVLYVLNTAAAAWSSLSLLCVLLWLHRFCCIHRTPDAVHTVYVLYCSRTWYCICSIPEEKVLHSSLLLLRFSPRSHITRLASS